MNRRLEVALISVVAAAMTVLMVPPAALAGPDGVGPQMVCPFDGWFLTPPSPGDTVVDRNGDGLICVKGVNGRGSSRDVPGFSVMDDLVFVDITAPEPDAPTVGVAYGVGPQMACPPEAGGWFLTPPSPGDTVVDRNGDGLICVKGVNGRGSSRDVPGFSVTDDLIFLVP